MFDLVDENEVLLSIDGPFSLRSGLSRPELKLAYKIFRSPSRPIKFGIWHFFPLPFLAEIRKCLMKGE